MIPKRCNVNMHGLYDFRCSGIKGHQGCHWAYDEKGALHRRYRKVVKQGISYSITPPDHEHYISPNEMMKECYLYATFSKKS